MLIIFVFIITFYYIRNCLNSLTVKNINMDNKKEKLNTLPQHVQVPHGLCKGQIDYQVLGLYAYLRRYMNKDTYSTFVSLRTLQGETKLSIPTIQKYLNILEEEDHIKIIKGEKRCNIYVFNKGSSLYSKGFEMYTFEFIKNKDIPFKEKCALIAFQERMMNKDSGRGTISSTPLEMSNILNTSFSTYKRIEKDLINNNWITIMKSNVKDSETGCKKNIYTFDLEAIGQAVLFNQKKIAEHDEMLHEMREEIKRLNHEVKLLHKELGDKNKESVKSPMIEIN